MKWYKIILRPRSDFGSTLKGDMLFGQFCWAVRERYGQDKLNQWLEGYTENTPYVIFSDAFPEGYLPRPTLPLNFWPRTEATERKEEKAKQWIGEDQITHHPANKIEAKNITPFSSHQVTHNSVNRITATVSGQGFDPYQTKQLCLADEALNLCLHVLLDENRLFAADFESVLSDMGLTGFGRDASIGMGRFDILSMTETCFAPPEKPNAFLTLAPAVVQGQKWQSQECYYRPFIRFGRHGNIAAMGENAFKKPIIMADSGAILTPADNEYSRTFIGQGLGGRKMPISTIMPETVQQGYAPVIAVRVEEERS